jgi:hypothetical protein
MLIKAKPSMKNIIVSEWKHCSLEYYFYGFIKVFHKAH